MSHRFSPTQLHVLAIFVSVCVSIGFVCVSSFGWMTIAFSFLFSIPFEQFNPITGGIIQRQLLYKFVGWFQLYVCSQQIVNFFFCLYMSSSLSNFCWIEWRRGVEYVPFLKSDFFFFSSSYSALRIFISSLCYSRLIFHSIRLNFF